MRSRHINFALAIAVSAGAHVLLWPAAKRITVSGIGSGWQQPAGSGEITLLLQDVPDKPPIKSPSPKVPKPPLPIEPPDEMGESTGKGIGAQAAKGETPLKAREADQDQAFLSRDPVGMGRVGDPPAFDTGPRGENGNGGQLGGGAAALNPPHNRQAADDLLAMRLSPRETKAAPELDPARQPVKSQVHTPEPELARPAPPTDVTPVESKTRVVGAAPVDVNKPAVDEVKAAGPLAQLASTADGAMALPPIEGAATTPRLASSSAPPPNDVSAPPDIGAMVIAPKLPLPTAPVPTPPPPAVEVALPKPREIVSPAPALAVASPASAARALVTNGDGRAPGRDRPAADPAQQSDSESDPFSKTAVADVLHDGRLEVRQGRKVKTTRPHFLPGAMASFYANPDATLVLKIPIDETGKVRSPEIIKSSGSIEIDQPCRLAVYDWWFEPSHDKFGKPVPDVIVFTFRFR